MRPDYKYMYASSPEGEKSRCDKQQGGFLGKERIKGVFPAFDKPNPVKQSNIYRSPYGGKVSGCHIAGRAAQFSGSHTPAVQEHFALLSLSHVLTPIHCACSHTLALHALRRKRQKSEPITGSAPHSLVILQHVG